MIFYENRHLGLIHLQNHQMLDGGRAFFFFIYFPYAKHSLLREALQIISPSIKGVELVKTPDRRGKQTTDRDANLPTGASSSNSYRRVGHRFGNYFERDWNKWILVNVNIHGVLNIADINFLKTSARNNHLLKNPNRTKNLHGLNYWDIHRK